MPAAHLTKDRENSTVKITAEKFISFGIQRIYSNTDDCHAHYRDLSLLLSLLQDAGVCFGLISIR
jgi:hypothetical protein